MKKIIACLVVFIMLFTTTGCNVSHEEEIRTAVDGFFTSFDADDIETAMTYTVGEKEFLDFVYLLPDTLPIDYSPYIPEGFGNAFDGITKEFMDYYTLNRINGFVIENVDETDGEATVVVGAKEIDDEYQADPVITDTMSQKVIDYLEAHRDELVSIHLEQGEVAAKEKMLTDLSPDILMLAKKMIDDAPREDIKILTTVKEVDGKWLLYKIELFIPNTSE